jgi:ribosomal-protein-alanine N-acetyltransferase
MRLLPLVCPKQQTSLLLDTVGAQSTTDFVFSVSATLYTLTQRLMIAALQTDRLLLQPLQLADAEQSQRLLPHWEMVKFMSSRIPWPYPEDGALTYYRDAAIPGMENGKEWHWTLRLRSSFEKHIGAISLFSRDGYATRGFWLGIPWQGRGLMTEAVLAVNDFCFDVLDFNALRAPKAIDNITSRRISEKTGMRVIAFEDRDYVCGRLPSEIWEITADEWRAKRQAMRNILKPEEQP